MIERNTRDGSFERIVLQPDNLNDDFPAAVKLEVIGNGLADSVQFVNSLGVEIWLLLVSTEICMSTLLRTKIPSSSLSLKAAAAAARVNTAYDTVPFPCRPFHGQLRELRAYPMIQNVVPMLSAVGRVRRAIEE